MNIFSHLAMAAAGLVRTWISQSGGMMQTTVASANGTAQLAVYH